jgi:Xaa-Pro aminopeptidase
MKRKSNISSVRISSLQKKLSVYGVEGLLFSNLINIRYLTGFSGSDGVLIISPEKTILLVDGRYITQAAIDAPHVPVMEYKDKISGICQAAKELDLNYIGFEAASLNVEMYNLLRENICDERLIPLADELKWLRACKDESEVIIMKKAACIAASAMEKLMKEIKTGWTEKDAAWQLELHAHEAGADQLAFDIIVAAGENSALPHAKPTNRKIRKGDLVVIDFGVKYQGYCSDETCTIAFGELTDKQKNAYEAVKQAHDRSIDDIREGVAARVIDDRVRDILGDKYCHYFVHGTGHGVGLEVHETPRLAPASKDILESGMVVTVEPGIYIPGHWGIRIEDTVLVKENSCEIFTKMNKELIIID